jgi:hypothetical protein
MEVYLFQRYLYQRVQRSIFASLPCGEDAKPSIELHLPNEERKEAVSERSAFGGMFVDRFSDSETS